MGIFDFLHAPADPERKSADRPQYEEEDCRTCGGSGWEYDVAAWDGSRQELCPECGGIGKVPK